MDSFWTLFCIVVVFKIAICLQFDTSSDGTEKSMDNRVGESAHYKDLSFANYFIQNKKQLCKVAEMLRIITDH